MYNERAMSMGNKSVARKARTSTSAPLKKEEGALQPGAWVAGRFQIVRVIGQGGFGTVYEASQESMGRRRVALKILTPRRTREHRAVERFRQEALLASRLHHPNTITLFDFGQASGDHFYIAMEYLEGQSLGAVIKRQGAMAPRRAEHIARQVLGSLSEAHAIGLIHRDLKPDNIFLTRIFGEADFAKVLDFGLAKMEDSIDTARVGIHDLPNGGRADLTLEGLVCGTPDYMAPEQAQGVGPLSPAVDVYAVGLLIYFMLTGRKPFRGKEPVEVLRQQVGSPLPALPGHLRNNRLAQIMRVSTRKRAAERYQDASQMLAALVGHTRLDPTPFPTETINPATQQHTAEQFPTDATLAAPSPFNVEVNLRTERTDMIAAQRPAQPAAAADEPHTAQTTGTLSSLKDRVGDRGGAASDGQPQEAITGAHPPLHEDAHPGALGADDPTPTPSPALGTAPRLQASQSPTASNRRFKLDADAPNEAPGANWPLPGLLSGQVPLIGREQERRKILGIVRRTADELRSHLVMLPGEAGVGKSRLLTEVTRIVTETSDVMVAGAYFRDPAVGAEAALPRLVGHLLGLGPGQAVELARHGRLAETLQRSLNHRGLHLGARDARLLTSLFAPDMADPASPTPSKHPALVLERLVRWIVRLAEGRPLMLVFEDLQLADVTSLDLLRRLCASIARHARRGHPNQKYALCLVMTLRPDTTSARGDVLRLVRFLESLPRRLAPIIPVERLDEASSAALIEALAPADAELRRRVADAGHGNPLHMLQILHHLYDSKRVETHGGQWRLRDDNEPLSLPRDLSEMVRLRARGVIDASEAPGAMQDLLTRLAILGRRVPHRLLRRLLDQEERPWPDALVEKLLAELCEHHQISITTQEPPVLSSGSAISQVHRQAQAPGEPGVGEPPVQRASSASPPLQRLIHFENGMLPEVLVREAERSLAGSRLHLAAAEAKLSYYNEHEPLQHPDELAAHLLRAGQEARALPYVQEAGQRRQQAGDFLGALTHYHSAEDLLNRLQAQGQDDAAGQAPRLWLAIGLVHWRLGNFAPSEHYLWRAIRQCESDVFPERGLIEARANLCLGQLRLHQKHLDVASNHLTRARELAQAEGDLSLRMEADIHLGELKLAAMGFVSDSSLKRFEQDLEALSEHAPLIKARGLQHLGTTALTRGDNATAERYLARARLIADELAVDSVHGPICSDLGYALLLQGRTAEGEGLLREALQIYRDLGDRLALSICQHRLGMAAWHRGAHDEALGLLHDTLTIQRGLQVPGHTADTLALIGRVQEAHGALSAATDAYRGAIDVPIARPPEMAGDLQLRMGTTLLKRHASHEDHSDLSLLNACRQHLEAASRHFATVEDLARQSQCMSLLAMAVSWRGELTQASVLLEKSAALSHQGRDVAGEIFALCALALVQHQGEHPASKAARQSLTRAQGIHARHLVGPAPLVHSVEGVLAGHGSGALAEALPPLQRAWICRLMTLWRHQSGAA